MNLSLFSASESKHILYKRFFILSLLSCNFDDQLNQNFHRFVILCICWDTPSKKTGLWQLPIVSIVFKRDLNLNLFSAHREFSTRVLPKYLFEVTCTLLDWSITRFWTLQLVTLYTQRPPHRVSNSRNFSSKQVNHTWGWVHKARQIFSITIVICIVTSHFN